MRIERMTDDQLAELSNELWEDIVRAEAADEWANAARLSSQRARVAAEMATRALDALLFRMGAD